MAKTAKKTSAKKTKQPKDRWTYAYDDELSFITFPSYEEAYKDAVRSLKDGSYYTERTKIKVQFFRLASESLFEFDVKETPVMQREVVFKGEVK